MGLTPLVAVAAPAVIGVLAWWALMLCAPLLLLRRWRRRRRVVLAHLGLAGAPLDAGTGKPGPSARSSIIQRGDDAPSGWPPRRSSPARQRRFRLPPATIEPLCRYVDFRRRLAVAVAELESRLAQLPADGWRIEPYPLTGDRGNSLLVLGETGVFVISATYAPGHWDDVVAVSRMAGKIQLLLPGHAGQVQPAICHPFGSLEPRVWHRADEHGDWVGAWVLGGDAVIHWLEHFGRERGLGA